MTKYLIDNTKIYCQNLLPFKGFLAMAIYGVIFWRKDYKNYLDGAEDTYKTYVHKVVNHENIHKAQMKDFFPWVPIGGTIFYLIYLFEWIGRLFVNGPANAYRNISFEQEAYNNETNLGYLSARKHFSQWRKNK